MASGTDRVLRFGPYSLHRTQGLSSGDQEVRVTQKALGVLWLLAERQGQVVTKDEIFAALWPQVAVSDAALTSCVKELRRVLNDDARAPRFIETRHRLGFKFLPAVTQSASATSDPLPAGDRDEADGCVGRAAALATLAASLARAEAGQRQLVVVEGEPGIGKSTLVKAFIHRLRPTPVKIATAVCVEAYGAGEPYRPLLDAVLRLCRQPGGDRLATMMRLHAPTWWSQFPGLHQASDPLAQDRYAAGVTRTRMSRELTEFLAAVAGEGPLVLWIDDAQWADDSTVDWIAEFTAQSEPVRLQLLLTRRLGPDTRVHRLLASMQLKPFLTQVRLTGLDETATHDLVARRQPAGIADVPALAARLHVLTEGHPLFLTALLGELSEDASAADRLMDDKAHDSQRHMNVPERLRALIDDQIDRLGSREANLLEVASLAADMEWSAAVVAAGSNLEPQEVEETLGKLARHGVFVRRAGPARWPDGTLAERFAFIHALHREVLARRLSGSRRTDIHRRIGARLEQAFGPDAAGAATPLAWHFEQAGDRERAVRHLTEAARAANRVGAAAEASRHASRALGLLSALPPSSDRDTREVELQMLLGAALMAHRGWGAPGVELAYRRARELCERVESVSLRFRSYWGQWLFYWGRGDLTAAKDLTTILGRLAEEAPDPMQVLQVHHAEWATAYCLGQFDAALEHAERGRQLSLTHVAGDATLSYGNHHAGVCAGGFAARALAALGRSGDARAAAEEAVRNARQFAHPFSLALALTFSAAAAHTLRDRETLITHATEAARISATHGFPLIEAWARSFLAWAQCQAGAPAEAERAVQDAVAAALATGSGQFRTLFLSLLAEVQLAAGHPAAGLATIADALDYVAATGERFHEAEVLRLNGLLLAANSTASPQTIVAAFERGAAIARGQGAHLLALRNLLAKARYQCDRNDTSESLEQLREMARLAVDLPLEDRNALGQVFATSSKDPDSRPTRT